MYPTIFLIVLEPYVMVDFQSDTLKQLASEIALILFSFFFPLNSGCVETKEELNPEKLNR